MSGMERLVALQAELIGCGRLTRPVGGCTLL
jgi:hypothetical protein